MRLKDISVESVGLERNQEILLRYVLSVLQLLTALIDSCISDSFINQQVANRLQLAISPTSRNISMALATPKRDVRTYSNVKHSVLKDLRSDIILGHDFQKLHKRLTIELYGSQSDLIVSNSSSCALSTAVID